MQSLGELTPRQGPELRIELPDDVGQGDRDVRPLRSVIGKPYCDLLAHTKTVLIGIGPEMDSRPRRESTSSLSSELAQDFGGCALP